MHKTLGFATAQFVASSLLLPLSPRSLRRPEHLRHFHHRRVARRRHLGRVVERDGHGDEQRRCGRWWRGAERQCVHAVQTLAAAIPATGTACASAVRRAASLALGLWTLQEFSPRGEDTEQQQRQRLLQTNPPGSGVQESSGVQGVRCRGGSGGAYRHSAKPSASTAFLHSASSLTGCPRAEAGSVECGVMRMSSPVSASSCRACVVVCGGDSACGEERSWSACAHSTP